MNPPTLCRQHKAAQKQQREAALAKQQQQQQIERLSSHASASSSSSSSSISSSHSHGSGNGISAAATADTASSSSSSSTAGKEEKEKAKPSVGEIFRVLAASVPIRCLAVMSLAQGLCTSLMEFAWKSHISLLFPSPAEFTSFLGDVSMWQGVVTGGLMVSLPLAEGFSREHIGRGCIGCMVMQHVQQQQPPCFGLARAHAAAPSSLVSSP